MNNTSNSISPYDFVLVPFSPELPRGGNPDNPPSVCRACIFFTDKTIKCEAVYTDTFCTGTNVFVLQHKVTGLPVPVTDLTDQYQRHKDEYPRSSCISVLHSSYKSGGFLELMRKLPYAFNFTLRNVLIALRTWNARMRSR